MRNSRGVLCRFHIVKIRNTFLFTFFYKKKLLKVILFIYFTFFTLNTSLYSKAPDKSRRKRTYINHSIFDNTHRFISNGIIDTAVWFDDFFSDKRILDEDLAHASVRMQNDFRLGEGTNLSHRLFFHMNLRLKKFPEKMRLLIIGENTADTANPLPSHPIEPGFRNVLAKRIIYTGTKYNFIDSKLTKYFIEPGMKLDLPLNPYCKARFRQRFPLSKMFYIQFAETVIWKRIEGWRESTELDFSYLITSKLLLQLSNALSYIGPTQGIDWGSVIDFRYKSSERNAMSYRVGFSGTTKPETLNSYQVSWKLRRRFYRKWFFYEIEPINTWSINSSGKYISSSGINLRLEINFGN